MQPTHRQPVRLLVAVVLVVVAASLAVGLFGSGRAGAQTPDRGGGDGGAPAAELSPRPGAGVAQGDGPVVCDQPGPVLQPGCTHEDVRSTLETRSLLGLDEHGQDHPLSAYEIGCDEGGTFSFMRKLWCATQAMPFSMGKWAIGIGIDVLRWALEFKVATALVPLADTMSRAYDATLVAGLGLREVAWTVALAVAGWHLLRARVAASVRELATIFLVAAIGVFVVANPGGYLRGSVELAQAGSGAVVEAVNDVMATGPTRGASTAGEVRDQLAATLRRSFVAEPYDQINWGRALTGRCAEMRDAILDSGPHGTDDTPRDAMRAVGCGDEAEFNANPSDNRAIGSLAMMAASVLATVLLVVIGLGVFAAQLTLVFLWSSTALVWTIGLFPGGRGVLWAWLGRLVWSVLVTVSALFVTSWVALAVTGVLNVASDLSMLQRLLVVVVIVLVAYKLRTAINRGVSGATQRLTDRMRRITPNESAPSAHKTNDHPPATRGDTTNRQDRRNRGEDAMRKHVARIRRWLAQRLHIDLSDDRGSVFSEYGLLIGTIGLAGALAATALAARVTDWFGRLPGG